MQKSNIQIWKVKMRVLKSENDDLRSQIVEINKKEKDLEVGISRLHELENQLAVYEEEKAKMIANLELMVNQNKMISTPLKIP